MNKKTTRSGKNKRSCISFLLICLVSILLIAACDLVQKEGTKPIDEQPGTIEESNENNDGSTSEPIDEDVSPAQKLGRQVQQKISDMTLEEKVAQLFIITPEALTGLEKVTVADDATRNAIRTYPIGGIVYFGANIVSPDQIKEMTENTRKYAEQIGGISIFLAIDEEGGTVARIGNNSNFTVKKYSNMASVGATKDPEKAYEVGNTIGSYLQTYGLNLNFAPDADVLTNPNNKVVGDRSFGTDGNLVANMSLGVARGLAENRVLACFKHFPGHGATEGDTHEGFAYTNKTLNELMENELVPFQAAADNDIPFIMMSHISAPNIVGDNTPSSLSKVMTTDILRNQIGYNGIIITDAMDMGAIVNTYGAKDAVIQSFLAGVDMILMPQDFQTAYQGILDAVIDGTISEQRINQSLERILRVKFKMVLK